MIEDLPDVPPALVLLLKEIPGCSSWEHMRKRVREMLTELRDQSEAFEAHQISRETDNRTAVRFEIHLHGAADLLTGRGCAQLACRIAAAERVARSVGLIADRVWLTDLLSEKSIEFEEPDDDQIDAVIADILVLCQLLPLIVSGIVRFRSPWIPTCQSCLDHFYSTADGVAEKLTEAFLEEFEIERRNDGGFYVHTGICLEPTLVYHNIPRGKKVNASIPSPKEWARDWVRNQVESVFWTAHEASLTGGSVFSNSRVGLSGLLEQEGRLIDTNTLALLDQERSFSVPWVSELDANQILQLRQEASFALPQFRELIARTLAPQQAAGTVATAIDELRAQAAEVRSELEATRKDSARYWKSAYGVLGLGLSAYGVGADEIIAGAGGLLAVIHLLIDHKSGQEAGVSKLTTKPGYVLMKAQDILAHDH